MLSCLTNIVSVRGCGNEPSLSGLDLMDAPEISPKGLSDTANEEYLSGLNLARQKVDTAAILVRNDMLSVMATNRMLVDITGKSYETSTFQPSKVLNNDGKERGVTLYRANSQWRKSMKSLKIKTIKAYPSQSATGHTIKIYDSGANQPVTVTYSVDLVANQINEFDVDYTVLGESASVVITGLNMVSAYLDLCAGCAGRKPNDCGYTKSYYGTSSKNGREGYGIGLTFECECDYDVLMCNLAKTSLGHLIWLKARMGILEEQLGANRLNNWTIYNRDEVKDFWLPKLDSEYRSAWKTFASSLPAILKQYNGECIVCNGVKTVIVS